MGGDRRPTGVRASILKKVNPPPPADALFPRDASGCQQISVLAPNNDRLHHGFTFAALVFSSFAGPSLLICSFAHLLICSLAHLLIGTGVRLLPPFIVVCVCSVGREALPISRRPARWRQAGACKAATPAGAYVGNIMHVYSCIFTLPPSSVNVRSHPSSRSLTDNHPRHQDVCVYGQHPLTAYLHLRPQHYRW